MYDYPFRVPARFALIIRAVVSQEGLALRLDPDFRILQVAYPYVARRLLAGDTAEMREKLMEVYTKERPWRGPVASECGLIHQALPLRSCVTTCHSSV